MTHTIRDLNEARRFVLQSLWWQRVVPPAAATVRTVLEWAREIASAGEPLPPPGVVADLGHLALGVETDRRQRPANPAAAVLPINLLRGYEDHVLGRIDADWAFGRAGDALRRYQGRDRARGLAFFFSQFQKRCRVPGVEFSPAVLATVSETPAADVLSQGWASLERDGPHPLLVELYEGLLRAVRGSTEFLGAEDLFELEHGTALADLGERLARRQVLRAVGRLEAVLPRNRVRPAARRTDVPTHLLDEDTYPVGGFSSLSTRGTVESLLHSQLAFMETDERPDLFDVKFLRDELLYYARDENQFLRRRRTFVFVLQPDLIVTRFKDADLPYQRGVLLLALVVLAVRRLTEWLSADALQFKIVFVTDTKNDPLAAERALLRTLLPEGVASGTVELLCEAAGRVGPLCAEWARRSLCHCVSIAAGPPPVPDAGDTVVARLRLDGPEPALGDAAAEPLVREADTPLESWGLTLQELLQRWV
jgi:vWA domain found in the FtsH ternary systems/N-terminal helical region fused to the FtsH ternary system vWA domain